MGLLDATAFQRFRDGFAGTLLEPGEAAYDDARALFNAMIDRRPALIAQCASPADVVAAVRFGREAGLEIAVRGGGHGVGGRALCDDGLVIDLRRINAVSVDPGARVAVVGAGATMSNLDRATEPFGLATTGGRVSTTGVGVFGLGGAVARETADWPVPWRSAPWCVHPFGLWSDRADDARGRQWAHDVRAAVAPWATGAVYLNFIGEEGEERVVAGFGADAYRRLGRVKRDYDPDNVFHLNHNIRPA